MFRMLTSVVATDYNIVVCIRQTRNDGRDYRLMVGDEHNNITLLENGGKKETTDNYTLREKKLDLYSC